MFFFPIKNVMIEFIKKLGDIICKIVAYILIAIVMLFVVLSFFMFVSAIFHSCI